MKILALLTLPVLLAGCPGPQPTQPKSSGEVKLMISDQEDEVRKLHFVVLMTGQGQVVLYEAARTRVDRRTGYIEYTNTEGAKRYWSGEYFISDQPMNLKNAAPMIPTQTSTIFRVGQ